MFTIEFIVSSVMISVALMMIGLEFLTESETARVEEDRIVFNSSKAILFSEIKHFTFDNSFKLKESSRFWGLEFLPPRKNRTGHARFLEDFRSALADWKEQNQGADVVMPQQKYFYGT